MPKQTLTTTAKFQTIPKRTKQIIKETEDLDLPSHPVRPVVELTTAQRNATLKQTQQTDRLPAIDDRKDKTKSNREMLKAAQMASPSCSPNFKLAMPRLHSGTASDRPETNEISILSPIPEVVWQQHRRSLQINII